MSEPLRKAINNNVGLYQAILGRLGIPLHVTADIAYTTDKAPTYYSNLVTRSDRWRPDEDFHRIARTAKENGWADWSIKDSHDVLDLAPYGLRRLFRATWVHLDPSDLEPPRRSLRFEIVRNEDGLSRWRSGWDADPRLGVALFGPELLRDPDLHFVAGYDGDVLVCGSLINRTDDVLGVSNLFAHDASEAPWAAAAAFILDRFGPSGLVGYARDAMLDDLRAIGFAAIGDLSVWRCPADPGGPA